MERTYSEKFLVAASRLKIAVVGDLIIDDYVIGEVRRISPEAPIPVLFKTDSIMSYGGAGNVWNNLRGIGVRTDLYCCKESPHYTDMPEDDGSIMFTDYHEPISRKIRFMAGNHQLLRVDVETEEDQRQWPQFKDFSWWRDFIDRLKTYDAIVLADYGKGVLGDNVINTILELAFHEKIPVIVDAKKDFERYSKATVVKCNNEEYKKRSEAFDLNLPRSVVVTRGSKGIWYRDQPINLLNHDGVRIGDVDGIKINVVDVCGAGDTVTAILAIGESLVWDIHTSCDLANWAAAEVCRHPRVYPIKKEDFLNPL